MKLLCILLVLLAATPSTAAQVVIVDDDGGPGVDFTSIQAAVDGSPDGAIVLVRTGSYGQVTIVGRSITVAADAGAAVTVGSTAVQSLGSAQVVNLAGLDIHANFGGTALTMFLNDGQVFLDDCSIVGDGVPLFQTNHAATLSACEAVTFSDCSLSVTFNSGPYSGLIATNSNIVFYDSTVSAGFGTFQSIDGQPGAVLSGGSLFASATTFQGGAGADGFATPPFIPCTDGTPGGPGLKLIGGSAVARLLGCTTTGGPGGQPNAAPCNAGADGLPTEVLGGALVTLPYTPRHYSVTSPVVEGNPSSLTFTGQPGDFVWVFYDLVPSSTYINAAKGVLVPFAFDLYLGGPLPATGTLTVNFLAPDVPPGFPPIYEQGLFWDPVSKLVLGTPKLRLYLDG